MKSYDIAVLPGDGTGPEVVREGLKVLEAAARRSRFEYETTTFDFGGEIVWSQPYATAESMKVINLMGDDADELFIQNTSNVTIFDGSGNVLFSRDYQSPKTTLGDVNGDKTVNSSDLTAMKNAYGTTYGDSRWNAECDLDWNIKVDAEDLYQIGRNYGRSTP